jgi:TPR repeat protein
MERNKGSRRKASSSDRSGRLSDLSKLGNLNLSADEVAYVKSEAIKLCRSEAEKGNIEAQFDLGMFYSYGEGVRGRKKIFDPISPQ